MSDLQFTGPFYGISTATTGNRLMLGNADLTQMSGMALHFVNGADLPSKSGALPFAGSLLITGRLHNIASPVDNIPFVPIPFRALYLNGAPSDGSLQPGGTLITDTSWIVIPLMSGAVAIECSVGAGTAYLYKMPLGGTVYP